MNTCIKCLNKNKKKNNCIEIIPEMTIYDFSEKCMPCPPCCPCPPPCNLCGINCTSLCFIFAQLAHIIKQIILFYPNTNITVYTTGFVAASVSGTPYQLYYNKGGIYGGLFVLKENDEEKAIPLYSITAIELGSGAVYNPAITYLSPCKFPPGCDTNIVNGIHDYIPPSTDVQLYLGSLVQVSGTVYKNEYGIIVLTDEETGGAVFVTVNNITAIVPTVNGSDKKANFKLQVTSS